jgi:hypothetical protein
MRSRLLKRASVAAAIDAESDILPAPLPEISPPPPPGLGLLREEETAGLVVRRG